jgi:hypothetical protein
VSREPDRGEPGRAFSFADLPEKEERSMRDKSHWNQSRVLAFLILFILIGCTELRISPPVVKMRQDMDNIVNSRGIPRNVSENFVSAYTPMWSIALYYPDAVYHFQTDESKSYTVLTGQQTISFGDTLPQKSIATLV